MGNIEQYRVGQVSLTEIRGENDPWFVVMDGDHYRVRIVPCRKSNGLYAGIDAEADDDRPGDQVDYTPFDPYGTCYGLGEVSISDDGLLSAMGQRQAGSYVVIHTGWTAQLPVSAVEPIRRALELAEKVLAD